MRLTSIHGIELPIPIDVYGWRFPEGELESKAIWDVAAAEYRRLSRDNSGVGIYRSMLTDGGDYFVFVVDVDCDLLGRSEALQGIRFERTDPPQDVAVALAMRHLRETVLKGPGEQGSENHYGRLGAIVDELGEAHRRVGHG